ncbi:MAG: hypothetical protein DMG55_21075 [Acidobacteria bacterium]|nr:MAG: hypothetical protein DMG55_21075 [Acidobacteriota bacterium]
MPISQPQEPGEISGQGDLYLDGEFEGKIRIADGSFIVGPNAYVTAEIEAREIIIHGEVIGTLKGERVQVSSTGRVTGDMETRGIVIEDGAVLRSKVQGCQENQPAQLSPPAVAPRAKEVAAAGGAQASNRSSEAGDFFIVARCEASSSANQPNRARTADTYLARLFGLDVRFVFLGVFLIRSSWAGGNICAPLFELWACQFGELGYQEWQPGLHRSHAGRNAGDF